MKLFPGKLRSHWIGPFVVSNVFSYGAVEITSLERKKVLKVNEHQLKTFYEGWMIELTAFVELVEPIYEAWACDVSNQWHKIKALIRRQPKKKKFRFAFLFPYLLFFTFNFMFVILLYSFSFILTLRTMLCLKCGGIWRVFVFFFLCCFYVKKNIYVFFTLSITFYLLNPHWFIRIWVLCWRIN